MDTMRRIDRRTRMIANEVRELRDLYVRDAHDVVAEAIETGSGLRDLLDAGEMAHLLVCDAGAITRIHDLIIDGDMEGAMRARDALDTPLQENVNAAMYAGAMESMHAEHGDPEGTGEYTAKAEGAPRRGTACEAGGRRLRRV